MARVVPAGLFSTCTVVLQDLLLHLLHYLLSQGRNYSVQVKQSTSHVSWGSELGIIKIINSQVTQKDVFHQPVLQLTKNGSVKKKDGRGWQSAFKKEPTEDPSSSSTNTQNASLPFLILLCTTKIND